MTRRKPHIALLVISDGGYRKGGTAYGSLSVGGFPDESPIFISRIELPTAHSSSEAEAAILAEAVFVAVTGVEARDLKKKHIRLQIESDAQTLIALLEKPEDTGESFTAGRVKYIHSLVEGFGEVIYRWVPRSVTKGRFGH